MLKIVRRIHEINKELDIYKKIGKYAYPIANNLKCEKYPLMMMLRESTQDEQYKHWWYLRMGQDYRRKS